MAAMVSARLTAAFMANGSPLRSVMLSGKEPCSSKWALRLRGLTTLPSSLYGGCLREALGEATEGSAGKFRAWPVGSSGSCGGCCVLEAEVEEGCVSIRRWRSAGLRLLNQASKAALSGVPSAEGAAGCVCSAGWSAVSEG